MDERELRTTAAAQAYGAVLPLLILVMILFALVVGYGWLRLLASAMDPLIAGFVAALITVIALLLARMVGKAVITGRSDPSYMAKLLFLYPILFIISALGTINAAFYNFEGSSVLRQVIDDAEKNLTALDEAAKTALRDEGPQAEAATAIARLLVQLESEIKNPLNCGSGPNARRLIARIHAILPEFEELSRRPGMRGCDAATLDAIYDTYARNATRMLGIDPERQARIALTGEIADPIANARKGLAQAKIDLATGHGFGNGYGDAQLAIERAGTIYSDGLQKLRQARPDAAKPLAEDINVAPARDLGSITAMPGTLANRLDYWTTWVYFIIALALDFFLIFLFVEGLRGAAPPPVIIDKPRSSDPQFLWVNQGA